MCMNNMFIIYKNKLNELRNNEKWCEIMINHNLLKETNGKGKNNKIRFKLMDIDDLMNKNWIKFIYFYRFKY